MKTSRQRVFEYIQDHRTATAAEISLSLQMTPANARHHLACLKQEGLVETIGEQKLPGKGRPEKVYQLSKLVIGNNYDQLASALMSVWFEELSEDSIRRILSKIARRLASSMSRERLPFSSENTIPHRSLSKRLNNAIKILNSLHYQARWEAHAEAPKLFFGNCPYRQILGAHPELCLMDRFLIEVLLSASARQNVKLGRDPRGATFCIFSIGISP